MPASRNPQSKFITPLDTPVNVGKLVEYTVGTSVKIDGEWYLIVEVGGSKEVFLMANSFFVFNLPGNTPVQQAGYATVNVTPYN